MLFFIYIVNIKKEGGKHVFSVSQTGTNCFLMHNHLNILRKIVYSIICSLTYVILIL